MNTESILNIKTCSVILIIGIALDEITTLLSVNSGILNESNPIVQNLIVQGLWSYADISLIVINLAIFYIFSKIRLKSPKMFILVFFAPGLIRFLVGVQNLSLMLSLK